MIGRLRPILVLTVLVGLLLVLSSQVAMAQEATPTPQPAAPPEPVVSIPNETCLSCHTIEGGHAILPSGEQLSITVDPDTLAGSVHAGVACQSCHSDIAGYPHGEIPVETHRDLQVHYSQSCNNCHPAQALEQVDSVHARVRAAGVDEAAVCADCHGSHDIQPISHEKHPDVPGIMSVEACSQCHSTIYEKFKESVHGVPLYEGSKDVPNCIYCHPAHTAEDPRTLEFRLGSPQICGSCHGDEELMAKYGISTQVFDTYVSDFHGTTVMLFDKTTPDQPTNKAVCIDCHHAHDIRDPNAEGAQLKENLVVTCQECHPDATTNFADSWLGHYIPTWETAPLVTAVNWFYAILIPAVLLFFIAYIALDIWRRIRERRARRPEATA
jgi:predicted CXXCH cytochrome family protein